MSILAEIPYGAYWSTPFSKWQNSFSHLNSIKFASHVAKKEMTKRNINLEMLDYGVLGTTVPQKHSFYGLPWLTGMIGLKKVGGPTLSQACATGVRCMLNAVQEIEIGLATNALVVTADRCSNGPHLYYPNPKGPGGTGESEDWVLDNFSCDPLGSHAMLETAENVAKKYNVSTAEQHEVVLQRQAQYQMALDNDSAFLKRFMTLPFEIPSVNFKKTIGLLNSDEGLTHSDKQGLDRLDPVINGGVVTYGGQTHPADGNAGMIITTPKNSDMFSQDPSISIKIIGFGSSRVKLAHMPEAPIPAAQSALRNANLTIEDIDVFKTHNPFAVNDIVFSREMGVDISKINNFGSSLIWGHPQGPTGTRSIIELIEELVIRGGGYGLFTGCAAGDTGMAVILKVESK